MKTLTVLNSQRATGCAEPGARLQLHEFSEPCDFRRDAGAAPTLAAQFHACRTCPPCIPITPVKSLPYSASSRTAVRGQHWPARGHSMRLLRTTATPCSMPLALRPAERGAPGIEA